MELKLAVVAAEEVKVAVVVAEVVKVAVVADAVPDETTLLVVGGCVDNVVDGCRLVADVVNAGEVMRKRVEDAIEVSATVADDVVGWSDTVTVLLTAILDWLVVLTPSLDWPVVLTAPFD